MDTHRSKHEFVCVWMDGEASTLYQSISIIWKHMLPLLRLLLLRQLVVVILTLEKFKWLHFTEKLNQFGCYEGMDGISLWRHTENETTPTDINGQVPGWWYFHFDKLIIISREQQNRIDYNFDVYADAHSIWRRTEKQLKPCDTIANIFRPS